jgi:oxidoreductase
MGNRASEEKAPEPLRKHVTGVKQDGLSAVVIGGTGATGQSLVYFLLKSPEWSKVTTFGRRDLDLAKLPSNVGSKKEEVLTEEQIKKLTQHNIDMSKIVDEQKLFEGHDVTFCVLGTTRDTARTAENFRKVDFDMVRDAGIASKNAGIPHFSLMTSQGANANVWANEWKIGHGLYYLKIKGLIEKEIIDMKFPRTSIFRPGMLERPNSERWVDKISIFTKTHVAKVALVMMLDAESEPADASAVETPVFYENNLIFKLGDTLLH